jgi:hypothetical protein
MTGVPLLLFATFVASLLVFLGWALPHRSQIEQGPTRLVIQRPMLARFVTDLRLVLSGALAAYLLALFITSRQWIPVALGGLIVLRTAWVVKRSRDRGRLVIDRQQERITIGGQEVGQTGELVAVEVAQRPTPGVILMFRELGKPDRGQLLPAADRSDAEAITAAIAGFLRVPIVESPDYAYVNPDSAPGCAPGSFPGRRR